MREYGKVLSSFWTRGSGKQLRGHPEAQLVALYLFSAPAGNWLGLFYCPLHTIAHETGLPVEGARKGLRRVSEVGMAHFDPEDDLVWLPAAVRISTAPRLAASDHRCKGLSRDLELFGTHRFASALLHRYQNTHHLYVDGLEPSPLEAPSEPHRSQDQDQEQSSSRSKAGDRSVGLATDPPASQERDQTVRGVFEHWQATMGTRRAVLDRKRQALIAARLRDYGPDDLCRAIDGCAADPFSMGQNDRHTKYNGLELILRDAAHIEKFMALADPDDGFPKGPAPPCPDFLTPEEIANGRASA